MGYSFHVYKLMAVVLMTSLICDATDDVNIREFEMVADHLGEKDCRRLIEALHQSGFFLRRNVTGSHVSKQAPCIDMLLTWNRRRGSKKMALGEIMRNRSRYS